MQQPEISIHPLIGRLRRKNDDPGDKRENKRIKFFEENPGQIVRKLKSKKKRLLKRNATPSVVRDRQSQ